MMLATYVPAVKTPLDFEAACERMRQALHVVTGERPSQHALALSLAKCALETGRWQSMWNHNWGNAKSGQRHDGMFTCYPCNEILNGKVVWFAPEGQLSGKGGSIVGVRWSVPDGHPQTRFRAYANGYDGAQEYVQLLSDRFSRSFKLMMSGAQPVAFVYELKAERYFTADPAPYAKAVTSLFNEFSAKIAGKVPPPSELRPHEEDVQGWIRLAALTEHLDFGGADNLLDPSDEPTRPEGEPVA